MFSKKYKEYGSTKQEWFIIYFEAEIRFTDCEIRIKAWGEYKPNVTKDLWLSWPSECQLCTQALSHRFKGTCTFFQIRSQLTDNSDSLHCQYMVVHSHWTVFMFLFLVAILLSFQVNCVCYRHYTCWLILIAIKWVFLRKAKARCGLALGW